MQNGVRFYGPRGPPTMLVKPGHLPHMFLPLAGTLKLLKQSSLYRDKAPLDTRTLDNVCVPKCELTI